MREAPATTGDVPGVTGQQYSPGLEGIVAARTSMSDVNGRTGKLLYRGFDIAELAEKSNFEETCFLLYTGRLPTKQELEHLRQTLGRDRALPPQVLAMLVGLDPKANPMDLLRTGVSALAHFDADVEDMSTEANIRKAHRLVGQTATLVAAIGRLHRGLEPLDPDPARTVAGDFLRMYTGEDPDPLAEKVFDVCLILHADHGLNASTFAARVIASTLSDMHSAVTGAIGALKGPLHGGANAAVMEMLEEIGEVDKADVWVRDALANKKRVMGFGHRVYKVYDPRATVLKKFSKDLGIRAGEPKWYDMSEKVEKVVLEVKHLNPNVDFYSASTYHVMGLDRFIFTPIFALSRMAGWTAHILEQYEGNRLMRPESEYIGPPSATYVPLEERG
ncbi:MAG TPA: citrate synthase [Candidatus Dormibacteraeota bacterium]|nr:citrate synthase [Candidatus Dormibacteraeota bacterium]